MSARRKGTKTGVPLKWGKNRRGGKTHTEWHAPCGCAWHPKPKPHWHPCRAHDGIRRVTLSISGPVLDEITVRDLIGKARDAAKGPA